MAKDWIDVADTAVKIGLGGLITGVFTFIGVRFSHRADKEKHLLEHTTKTLELISQEIEEYFRSWNYYISKISGIAKVLKANGKEVSEFQKKSIKERDDILVESWAKRESAKSKAYLLKANKVVTAIVECKKLEKELRDKIVFEKLMPTYEEIEEYRERKKTSEDNVHIELSNYYASLRT